MFLKNFFYQTVKNVENKNYLLYFNYFNKYFLCFDIGRVYQIKEKVAREEIYSIIENYLHFLQHDQKNHQTYSSEP